MTWYLGAMNDACFIIDTPPRPSTDDVWHERPDGPTIVLGPIGQELGRQIVAAHNAPSLPHDGTDGTEE